VTAVRETIVPGRFDGMTAIVTGAAGGIGRATALRLGAEGANVLCLDVQAEAADGTAAAIDDTTQRALGGSCDISDAAAATTAVERAISTWGGVDVLCNVAGIGGSAHTHEETDDHWQRTLDVNLTGTFNMSRAAIPALLESRGAIVSVASTAGLIGQAYAAAYCASKHGVVGLMRALAIEYGRKGLRANAICPGGTDTGILDNFAPPDGGNLRLMMRAMLVDGPHPPEGIAAFIAYVASPEAEYINGAALAIDGGATTG
jgi:meso-butanediol dehydrogenase / (S,S)-butanediol dehydrogenase / diacetyl reductase